jgi:hypothetical protein
MHKLRFTLQVAIVAAATALASAAQAADAAHAWGTVSNPGAELLNSAQIHEEGAASAQIVSQGSGFGSGSGFPAVTSCGTCTTISIQGNNDTINGNTISSTNSGTVTSNGFFNQ